MSFWLAATALPVVTALFLFRPLLRRGSALLGLGLALLLLVPVTTLFLYQGVGTPAAVDLPARDAATDATSADMNALLAQLEQRMAQTPDDLEGWMLLGRSYRSMQRYEDARAAFVKARALAPDNPVVAVELAEALIFTSPPGQPDPGARELLDQALAAAPDLQKGLWLAGMLAAQQGDDTRAVTLWERLMAQLDPGSEVAASVQEQLDAARTRLGQPAPAAWAGIEVRVVAPDDLPHLSPTAALFVIVRDPAAPNPPLGAARVAPAFPAVVQLTDANSMLPQRPLSGATSLTVRARLSLSGNPLPGEGDLESAAVTVAPDREAPIQLQLEPAAAVGSE